VFSIIGTVLVLLNISATASYRSRFLPDTGSLAETLQQYKLAYNEVAESGIGKVSDQHAGLPQQEIQHVAFLKVHKAASSTAQNIFMRFGWRRNSTFVLSPAKNPSGYANIISLRESLTENNILPPPDGKHYDILCNHVFYTKKAFSHFMPNDTAFIAIIREPFELYKSILNYFRPRYIFNKIDGEFPASQFLRDPKKYEPPGRLSGSWTNSRMAIEFGFPESVFREYNQTAVDAYLAKLDKEFRVVILAEYFEDSVVLLRRLLHWQTQDILFLKQNVARNKDETKLSKAFDRDFYKQYAKVDYALYTFFYRRLREQIRAEGSDYDDELLAYKELRKRVEDYCFQNEVTIPMEVPETTWGKAFQVSKADCADMRRGELDFVTRIRVRQYGSKDI